jgi:hypothetical protein
MNIPLKAITITYTKTITVAPTTEMFEDWDCEPDQEGFESLMLGEFFDSIFYEVGCNGSPMDNTDVQRFEDVVIDWENEDDD